MQRTNPRLISLPVIVDKGHKLAIGLSQSQIEELNARSVDYGRRTAVPTLDDYVLEPFSTTFKERVFAEAVKTVGLNPEGILNDKHSIDELINGKKFVARAYPTYTSQYEVILSLTKDFLNSVIADNVAGVTREGIRKVDVDAYIFIGYFLDEINRFKGENTTRFNKRDLTVKDPATDEVYPLDEEIGKMLVYLDLKRFAKINPENADGFHDAKSLQNRIQLFLKDFKGIIMKRYSISPTGLKERQAVDYELSDGSAVRYLFSPELSTEHGQIYSGLVGRETKNIAASNGDLDILKELAFKDPYEFLRGEAGLRVATDITDKVGKKGIVKITRLYKDGSEQVRAYSVFGSEGRLYIKVNDIMHAMQILTQQHTSIPTQLKIDFFAAPPSYLR